MAAVAEQSNHGMLWCPCCAVCKRLLKRNPPGCMAAEQLHIPDEDDEDLCVGEFEDMMVSR